MEKLFLSPPSTAHRRGRQSRDLLFTKTRIETFRGSSIEGICTATLESSHQNGKWSTVTYAVYLAPDVQHSLVIQHWETGQWCNDVSSIRAIQEKLGLTGVAPAVVKEFIKAEMPGVYAAFEKLNAEIQALEGKGIEETMEYNFHQEYRNRRCGHSHLLINGEVWSQQYNPMPEIVVVKQAEEYRGYGGGGTKYILIIDANAEIEELYESNYGGDALDTRGFVKEDAKGWILPPQPEKDPDENPFTALNGLFK